MPKTIESDEKGCLLLDFGVVGSVEIRIIALKRNRLKLSAKIYKIKPKDKAKKTIRLEN
jgi:hypothetical protein